MIDFETIFDSDREEYEFMQEKKEQPMKEQIEELTKDLCDIECKGMKCNEYDGYACEYRMLSEALYNAGYRKQREGEWKRIEVNGENYGQVYYQHKDCKVNETQIFPSPYHFCPNCGAHMRGGKNE